MQGKRFKVKRIYYIFWFLLAYIIAALIFWCVELYRQTETISELRKAQTVETGSERNRIQIEIEDARRRKIGQYTGEGIIFFLVIIVGAGFIFRAVRRQLRQSEQQQNFMMGITHELKTPIAVAQLNLETLRKRRLDEPTQQKLIQATLEETNRLNALCNNMLLASQIDAEGYKVTWEEINFSDIVNGSVNDFLSRFPNKDISTNIDENVFINGDRLLLQIAVNNLIDNAIKYSPRNTMLTVKLSSEGEKIILSVADNGAGISAQDKQKVFEKFYRAGNPATKAAKGTGLGLYITMRVIFRHSGKILVEDNKPAGTIFTVFLQHSKTTL